jgi:hypothetical protein
MLSSGPRLPSTTVAISMANRSHTRMLEAGIAELRSPPLSPIWRMTRGEATLATARRYPRQHFSRIALADGTIWILHPERWGVVQAVEDEAPFARATRNTWSGRHWEVGGVGFSYELRPRSLLFRRWSLHVGNEPVVNLRGRFFSYNRMQVEVVVPVPLVAVLLSWHVIVRSWEAAASSQLVLHTGRTQPGPVADPG